MLMPNAGFWRRRTDPGVSFTFKTKASGEVTFSITTTGDPATWNMGDGTIISNTNEVTHTYADATEKTVTVTVDDYANVTGLGSFANKAITFFDASQLNAMSGDILFNNNNELTEFLPPTAQNSHFTAINFDNCDLTGSISWSGLLARGRVSASNNTNLTEFIHPLYIAGTTIDFRGCTSLESATFTAQTMNNRLSCFYQGCTALTTFYPHNANIRTCDLRDTNITGELDLSTCNLASPNNGCFWLTNTPLCTNILFKYGNGNVGGFTEPNSFRGLSIVNTGLTHLDLSGFTNLNLAPATANPIGKGIEDNPFLTQITFPDFAATNSSHIDIKNNNITGIIDWKGINFIPASNINVTEPGITDFVKSITTTGSGSARFNFTGCTGTGYFDCLPFADFDSDSSPTNSNDYVWADCNLSATDVNHFLIDIDNNSTSQSHPRVISFTGSNAAPDSSSGGYDGLAAIASLISKGFTVNTN